MATTVTTKRGDNFLATFPITDAGGAANLTGASARMQLRDTRTKALALEASTVDGTLSIDVLEATVSVNIPAATMEAVGAGQKYKADIEFTFSDGKVRSSETFAVLVDWDWTYTEA